MSDPESQQQLFTSLYDELHSIARRELRRRGGGLTLGSTTLLHETFLNLKDRRGVAFPDRAHFLSYASRAMRGLIIDYARSRRALKRGAAFEITSLPENIPEQADAEELQRLGEAIEQLTTVEPRLAQLVDLRYFGGFSCDDIAAMWGVSERTVRRDWSKARVILSRSLGLASP